MDRLSVPRRLAVVDALVLAASANAEAGAQCLEFIAHCVQKLHLPVLCGLSNISFGLPARELLNASFLGLAAGAGMNACIANPSNVRIREIVDAANLLLGHDAGAEKFISAYAGWEAGGTGIAGNAASGGRGGDNGSGVNPGAEGSAGVGSVNAAPLSLEKAVIEGRGELMEDLLGKVLADGADPFALVGERLIPAINIVGERYERKEYFLPQLIRSAEAMQTAFGILKPFLEKAERSEKRPVVIMATVEGDIHDIGKNIVSLMLRNHGFEVVDMGKDVEADRIVEQAAACGAALIGLSALMTTTMVRMRDTVDLIRKQGLAQKVMVGGAVVTEEFAETIGAYYSADAVAAVHLAKKLLSEHRLEKGKA
jgi:5-methyltetrahydrofolate--homocysteine methyltransferase